MNKDQIVSKTMIKEQTLSLLQSVERPNILALIEWLKATDYFTAPASTKYHLAYEGGLAEHSLNVYEILSHKNIKYKLELERDTIIITELKVNPNKVWRLRE